jgi:hypothetical protein
VIVGNNTIASGSLWSPRALSGLVGWWRADDAVDIGGGVISQLYDRSGNGLHATQATPANRGTRTTSAALRNREVISLDGTDYYTTAAVSLPRTFSVFYVLGTVSSRGMIIEHAVGTSWYVYSSGAAAVSVMNGGSFHRSWQSPPTTWCAANQQGAAIYDRASAPQLRGNRVALTPSLVDGSVVPAGSISAALSIGARPDGSLGHTGQVAETILYNRELSAAEVGRVEAYLRTRYGV